MKTVISFIFALFLMLQGAFALSQEKNYPQGMQNCTVELNGDSILFGFHSSMPNYRLSTTPKQWLNSRGFNQIVERTAVGLSTYDLVRGYSAPYPGAPTAYYPNGAQQAFNWMPHDSRIVVIETGINDFPTNNPYQVYLDYVSMVQHVRNLGKIPVITGIIQVNPQAHPADTINRLNTIRYIVKQVAIDYGVHYASWDQVPVAWTDGTHLNQDSSNGVTENLRYVLSWICGIPF